MVLPLIADVCTARGTCKCLNISRELKHIPMPLVGGSRAPFSFTCQVGFRWNFATPNGLITLIIDINNLVTTRRVRKRSKGKLKSLSISVILSIFLQLFCNNFELFDEFEEFLFLLAENKRVEECGDEE
jgi:hypothetical protein